MSEPTACEIKAVTQIPLLTEQEIATLYQILVTLGFDIETIALFWEKTEAEVKFLFRIASCNDTKVYRGRLTGPDLAWWCNLVRVKPGVVQKRLNFDESKIKTRKVGFKSTPARIPWRGPPAFAVTGSVVEGRAFCEVANLANLTLDSPLPAAVLSQIAAGKFPLRLPLLRTAVASAMAADVQHPSLVVLQNALHKFPPLVRIPEEVLEVLTTEKEEISAKTTKIPKEEPMRVEIIDRFRAEVAERRILPALQQLHQRSEDIRHLYHEWSIDVPGELFPGTFEVIVWSPAFENATKQWPDLTRPLQELGEWLAAERRCETKKIEERKVQRRLLPKVPPPEALLPAAAPSTRNTKQNPAGQMTMSTASTKVAAKPPKTVVATSSPLPVVPVTPDRVERDELGIVWNWTKHQVILGAVSISMTPFSDARLQGDMRTVSKRVYDSLCTIRNSVSEDAVYFCQQIGVERLWFSGLVDSSSQLTPVILKDILDKLWTNHNLKLTPAQLFGLKPLPEMVVAQVPKEASVSVPAIDTDALLFPVGDGRAGYRWASLLLKYRAVLKWFRQNYGVTDEAIVQIEEGKIGVPLAVHLVLLHKVKERLESSEGAIPPRSYQWFLEQSASKTVQDGLFVLDETSIPHKNWLSQ